MLAQYISAALNLARYERLPYGWLGYIPEFDGVWALDETQKSCEQELSEALEQWLLASREQGLPIPAIEGRDLSAYWAESRP